MKRSLALATTAALLLAAIPATAAAATYIPAKLTAPDFMLHPDDVPKALGQPKPGKNAYLVTTAGGLGPTANFELCVSVSGEPALQVPAAVGWMTTVELVGKGYREISEWASTFAGSVGGEANFGEVKQAAMQCNSTTTSPISTDGSHPVDGVYVNTNTSGALANGAVWISTDTKAKSKDPKINGDVTTTYTVFMNSLNVIVQTRLFMNGTGSTTPKQRRAVNRLAVQLMNNLGPPPPG